ncbi:DedA family protein [Planococcus sp. ISL-109]|uniref:DedA family protein n=1 Tax=Planococcus sp. ISL-109 TaxID=2819166 RepID=UPI001BECAF39|nr:DedA family protein [Planococcus sp. ISL-109]MBT2582128.1 DedA family protein [Planococcus sp. ISL-109]
MPLDLLWELVKEYGYVSMFLVNWLLLFGLPIPNEFAAAFSGVVTETSYFHPVPAFLAAYSGLITSNLFAYSIGRMFGSRLIEWLQTTFLGNGVKRFREFLSQKGNWAISFSFFLPGIRWAMPYVVGADRFPLPRYLLFAMPAGFVWMFVYFTLGRSFPYAYEAILSHLQWFLIALSATVIIALVIYLNFFRKGGKGGQV